MRHLNHTHSAHCATLRTLCALLLACIASACTTLQEPTAQPVRFEHDSHFSQSADDHTEALDPLVMSPAMRAYAEEHLLAPAQKAISRREPRQALLAALYQNQALRLQYDDSQTRTAAQAFEQRKGNCLSLVLMTAAFAKHLGLPITYQAVEVDENYERRGGLHLSSGHVNIVLERPLLALRRGGAAEDADLVVDFLPGREVAGARTRVISEATLLAMFHNNRAAELLAHGQLSDSYWSARRAVLQAPGFVAAMNTLGVVYTRAGLLQGAEQAYRQVLKAEPNNVAALSNLVSALKQQGRLQEAEPVARLLARLQPLPPFEAYDEGRRALIAGDFTRAKQLFELELQHQPRQPEVHHWAAVANWHLGNQRQAERHLAQARDHSSTPEDHGRYSAKLASLRASVN